MDEKKEALERAGKLVSQLADADAVVRQKAREQLDQLGGPEVTQSLVLALLDPRTLVRWESAKALQTIADPVAAPALMHALDDEDEDVRWVSAEALIVLGRVGLVTVLSGLVKRAGSTAFCNSAHHVLHELKGPSEIVMPVMQALEKMEPALAAPAAAYKALVALSQTPGA